MKYLWYTYVNVYSKDECQEIYEKIVSTEPAKRIDHPGTNKNVKVKIFETTTIIKNLLTKFFSLVEESNKECFGLDVFNYLPNSGNLNLYSENENYYGYHRDFSEFGSMQDVKLTAILNVSTKTYKGGEFDFFVGEDSEVTELSNPGSVLIFPSILWHRVRPVTLGERATISYWFCGPNFR